MTFSLIYNLIIFYESNASILCGISPHVLMKIKITIPHVSNFENKFDFQLRKAIIFISSQRERVLNVESECQLL